MSKFMRFETLSFGALAITAVWASTYAYLQGAERSLASIPQSRLPVPHTVVPREEILRDQRVSQQMTELDMSHESAPDFDADLARLSVRERQHREKLPGISSHPRLKSVVSRVAAHPYQSRKR